MEEYRQLTSPEIGLHVRRGDFRKLADGETFGEDGCVQTPLEYFIDVVRKIRKGAQSELPVTVFSDARKNELEQLLKLGNVYFSEKRKDIIDLLWLSKSKIIVCSPSSTFSYWAAFLSSAYVVHHPFFNYRILPDCDSSYEGTIEDFLNSSSYAKKDNYNTVS